MFLTKTNLSISPPQIVSISFRSSRFSGEFHSCANWNAMDINKVFLPDYLAEPSRSPILRGYSESSASLITSGSSTFIEIMGTGVMTFIFGHLIYSCCPGRRGDVF